MRSTNEILNDFRNTSSGTLIMTGKLYREKYSKKMSEAAFMQSVSRLCRSGKIDRVSKGVYCKATKTRFGSVLPSENEIAKSFTEGNKGVIVGYGLYNLFGLTTQVSKKMTVYSSAIDEQLKQIGSLTIRKYDIDYNPSVKNIIWMMELIHHYKEIQDINYIAFLRFIEQSVKEYYEKDFETIQNVIKYPKWTIAFLREILNYNNVDNTLDRYLSALTNYNIPKMEELYELARAQA